MPLMSWTKEQFGTDVSIFDQQHQTLFDLLNQLHDAIPSGDRSLIEERLSALVEFVKQHFADEERYMQQYGYPEEKLQAHQKEHQELLAACGEVCQKFEAGGDISQEVTQFVKQWLEHHIPDIDRDYGPFLRAKGVS